ncbi:MAG: ACP S-malonyltransferase [Massiliimalia sp.]|jgi:[acyl-carrier-protein] S-malonyltransferase
MSKNVFLFSGQGSQYPGMGLELAERYASSQDIFTCAEDILSLDLKKIFAESSAEELSQTKISQPAIFTVSLLALNAMKEEGISFDAVAGHSLGEYAAMVAAGVVSMEDGYRLIGHRAAAMQACAEQNPGAMYAVIGMSADEIGAVCEQVDGYVVPVNYNSPVQTVIAGETAAAEKAAETFAGMGKRCMKLAVSAAFHSKLMQPAADQFLSEISAVPFHEPQVAFYSNVTGEVLTDVSNMPTYLAAHLVSPVRFTSELALMEQVGFEHYVELGPNKVLTGLVKKTLKGASVMNVENNKTLDKALEILK